MHSKRSREGYFLLDSRHAPIPDATVVSKGLPPGSGRTMFEAPTYTCTHCQRVVVLNPDRSRERAYCRKCDAYICDGCGAAYAASGGTCNSFARLLDEVAEADAKGTSIVLP